MLQVYLYKKEKIEIHMKLDNRKKIIKELLSDKLSEDKRKKFVELPEVDSLLKKQWNEIAQEDTDWEIKELIWKKIKNKRENNKRKSFQLKLRWQAIAASVALLITTTGLWYTIQQTNLSSKFIEVTAHENQLYILPDSSKVWMQQGSSIRYAKAFTKDRKVWLKGNSLFEVTRQSENPFQVYINKVVIEVKGTSFLVEQPNSDRNSVTLFNGKIEFNIPSTKEKIIITPSQKVIYNIKESEVKIEQISDMDWKDGKYNFTDIPLEKFIKIINKVYNTNIIIADSISKKTEFTGSIRHDESLQDVITKIRYTLNLKQEDLKNEIIIKNKE